MDCLQCAAKKSLKRIIIFRMRQRFTSFSQIIYNKIYHYCCKFYFVAIRCSEVARRRQEIKYDF